MTAAEAERHQFTKIISSTIQYHSDKIWELDKLNFRVVFRLESALRGSLAPWFTAKAFISLGDVSWRWALAKPGTPFEKPQAPVALDSLHSFTQMSRIWSVEVKLESIRGRILRGAVLGGEELQFARCFRGFLETGLESQMPVLAIGNRKKRDHTFTEYFKTTALRCSPGCNCAMDKQKDQIASLAIKRKSNDPKIAEEKRRIKAWFAHMDRLKPSADDQASSASMSRITEIIEAASINQPNRTTSTISARSTSMAKPASIPSPQPPPMLQTPPLFSASDYPVASTSPQRPLLALNLSNSRTGTQQNSREVPLRGPATARNFSSSTMANAPRRGVPEKRRSLLSRFSARLFRGSSKSQQAKDRSSRDSYYL